MAVAPSAIGFHHASRKQRRENQGCTGYPSKSKDPVGKDEGCDPTEQRSCQPESGRSSHGMRSLSGSKPLSETAPAKFREELENHLKPKLQDYREKHLNQSFDGDPPMGSSGLRKCQSVAFSYACASASTRASPNCGPII